MTVVTAPIARLSHDGQAQHCHQCSWCGRMYGEFTAQDCAQGHVFHLCNSECEQSVPGWMNFFAQVQGTDIGPVV